jgi:cyclin C
LYHPYRPLVQFISDLCPDDTHLLQSAWRVVNDAYRTDVCLMYPPSLIALACLHIACVMQKKDTKQWFSELNVDMEKIFEITRHILYMYDILKTYDEKDQVKEILSKIQKPKLAGSASQQQQHHQQQHRPTASNTAQGHEMN